MRIEVVRREYTVREQLTLVNAVTRKFVAQMGPFDSEFNAQHIQEAVNLYADLHDLGLLKPALAAIEKRRAEQQK